jgi:hypothetical protein
MKRGFGNWIGKGVSNVCSFRLIAQDLRSPQFRAQKAPAQKASYSTSVLHKSCAFIVSRAGQIRKVTAINARPSEKARLPGQSLAVAQCLSLLTRHRHITRHRHKKTSSCTAHSLMRSPLRVNSIYILG